MPKPHGSVTKPFTLETFMKQATKLKITTNVIEDFIQALDELAAKITKTSETFAIKEQRKTIMPQDLEKALDEILKRGPLTVDELTQKIEPLSITELTGLSKKIKKMAEELLKPTSGHRVKRKKG
ncbi:MAG: NFYB/HAP3 family transcription factor subunit [bacterium]|nr:NFYB/HAP3 family transcription factor subunit [bacterium]